MNWTDYGPDMTIQVTTNDLENIISEIILTVDIKRKVVVKGRRRIRYRSGEKDHIKANCP